MAISRNAGLLAGGIGGADAASAAAEELRKLGISPEFFGGDYGEEAYAGDFTPTLFDDPTEAQYQTVAEDPRVRGMQMDALQQLIDKSRGAADMRRAADPGRALDQANQLARGREGAIRMDMERKGQAGSGTDAIMRAQASQMGANRARQGTQQAALDAALQKLTASQGVIQGAGNVRGQDFQRNATNSDIINRFNQFNTQARNAARQANVNMQNQASARNLDTRQGLGGRNAGTRNASIDRRDKLAQQTHGNKMGRWAAENDMRNQYANAMGQAVTGGVGLLEDAGSAAMAGMKASGGGGSAGGGFTAQGAQGPKKITLPEDDWEY